jgi:hypothetical protein
LDGKAWLNHGHKIGEVENLWDELNSRYEKQEFVSVSEGTDDGGKPVKLNSQGQIDPSMIDASTFYYVGPFNPENCSDPSTGCEYPDTTGESHGAFWAIQGMSASYTFQEGELAGKTIDNGDFMVWGTAGWSIMVGEMNPLLYVKTDKSVPFDDNGQPLNVYGQVKYVDAGVENTDAVNMSQISSLASLSYVDSQNAAQDTAIDAAQQSADNAQADIDSHSSNTSNPHQVTKSQVGLGFVTDTGSGDNFLADDGTYKGISLPTLVAGEYIQGTYGGDTYDLVGVHTDGYLQFGDPSSTSVARGTWNFWTPLVNFSSNLDGVELVTTYTVPGNTWNYRIRLDITFSWC